MDRIIVPSGWKLVPIEPTVPMLHAAARAMSPKHRPTPDYIPVKEKHRLRYQAMLAAAPMPAAVTVIEKITLSDDDRALIAEREAGVPPGADEFHPGA